MISKMTQENVQLKKKNVKVRISITPKQPDLESSYDEAPSEKSSEADDSKTSAISNDHSFCSFETFPTPNSLEK